MRHPTNGEVRRSLGQVGVFLPESPSDPTPAEVQRQACRRLEALGYRSAWTNELIGKDYLATTDAAAPETPALYARILGWRMSSSSSANAATIVKKNFPSPVGL